MMQLFWSISRTPTFFPASRAISSTSTRALPRFLPISWEVLVPDHPRKSRFPGGRNSACPCFLTSSDGLSLAGWQLHKMRVPCSACADWPRALQKQHGPEQPGIFPMQVTPGHDAERQLARDRHLHTHSACLSTAARSQSSEKHAPL